MSGRKILSVIPNLIYWVFCSGPVLCGVKKVLAKGARKRRWINFLHILPADWFSTNVHISFLGGKYWVSYRIWFSELFHHLVNHQAFFIEVLFLRWGCGWHDHLKNKSGIYYQPADTFTNRTVLYSCIHDVGWRWMINFITLKLLMLPSQVAASRHCFPVQTERSDWCRRKSFAD